MSIYLDLLRFLSAIAVFFHHLSYAEFTGRYAIMGQYGEDAVMVFFVLSGFLIAFVAESKETTPRIYFASRLARLYSVVIPALILTLVFDYIGRSVEPGLYAGWYQDSHPWVRILASLSFTNQLWSFDIRYFGNPPYWSISYEFWYYVFFGILMFARNKWTLVAAWTVFVGPLILLLLPVWMTGVWVYRLSKTFRASNRLSWLMVLFPFLAYPLYCAADLREVLTAWTDSFIVPITQDPYYLHKARFFLHDYVIAFMLAVHFLGTASLCRNGTWNFGGGALLKSLAAYTFTLYLLHYPLLYCLAALSPWSVGDIYRDVFLIGLTFAITVGVGHLAESRKGAWRRAILRTMDAVQTLWLQYQAKGRTAA